MTCLRPPLFVLQEWERDYGIPGVAGPAFQAHLAEVWARLGVNVEEAVLTPTSDVLRRGCEALGYRLGVDYHITPKNARGCGNRCDTCNYGCVYSAKQSTLVQNAIDTKVNGIAITLSKPDALAGAVQNATNAKIPVVAFNSGLDAWSQAGAMMYFGQDETIAGTAHVPNMERPEEFDRLVLDFLS